jgi:hypothetical protein
MSEAGFIRTEAEEALVRVWFVQAIGEIEHSDATLSLRLVIRPGLFVQVFLGEKSGSLYMALIEGKRRIFGIDRVAGVWHIHPYHAPERHEALTEMIPDRPLLRFLAKVEAIIVEHDLL